jgi:uncharacterized membrane protein YqhA
MTADLHEKDQKKNYWLKNMFVISRSLVVIAIIGLIITSILVIITGFAQLLRIISFLISGGFLSEGAGKFFSVNVTELIDLYLIGIVCLIIALGLYQLFIDPDLSLPEWLNTSSLEALKERLLVVILVVLPVTFLGYTVTSQDGIMIAGFGIGISLVMIAIVYSLSIAYKAYIDIKLLEKQGSEEK